MAGKISCFFRVDGGEGIGFGHLRRSVTLAEALEKRGARPLFLTRTPEALQRIAGKRWPVHAIRRAETERAAALRLMPRFPQGIVIADSYKLTSADLALYRRFRPVVFFDDYRHLASYPVDLILNYNAGAEKFRYPASARVLAGLKYVPVQPRVRALRSKKQLPSGRLLVALGGNPRPRDLRKVQKAAEALRGSLKVDIAAGFSDNRGLLSDFPGRRILPGGMTAAMARAVLVLSAAGVTTYELAFLGKPALLVTVAKNQEALARAFHQKGAAVYAGKLSKLSAADLTRKLEYLLANPGICRRMGAKAARLVDGRGAERLAARILKLG